MQTPQKRKENVMKRYFFHSIGLLLAVLLLASSLVSAQNAPVTSLGNADGCPGDTLTFPVSVNNFSQITAISLRIDFDPSKLTFVSLTNVNPALTGSLYNTVNASATLSKTLFIWSDMNPVTLPNDAILFELHYILNNGNPQLSFNNTDNLGGDCEYADAVGDPLNDLPTSTYYINGSATNNTPLAPDWIASTDSSFCAGTMGIQLTTQEIANAQGYLWTLPTGAFFISNASNDTIIIGFTPNAVSGNVTVSATNQCGTGPSSLPLPLEVFPLPAASTISGPTFPCQGSTKTFYAYNPMGGVTHQWEYPSGWTLVMGGNGTDSLRVTFDTTAGYVRFTPQNSCGSGTSDSIMVTPSLLPLQPTAIIGDTLPCVGTQVVYSVTQATNSYWWNVPAGWVINGGQSTHSITVTVGSGAGNLEVLAINGCGTASRSQAVWPRTVPGQPSIIAGANNPCYNTTQTYTIDSIAGTAYTWDYPSGWLLAGGQGCHAVNLITGANSGTITVTPSNVCGNGLSSTLSVTVNNIPAQPDSVYGETDPCEGSSQSYWVNHLPGVSHTWVVPQDWTITYGAGTDSIVVTTGAASGWVQATPSNVCGQGLSRSTQVSPMLLPVQPSIIAGDTFPCQGATTVYSVTNMQGTSFTWQIPAGWTIVSGQGTNTLSVLAGTQPGNLTVTPSNGCGSGPARSIHCSINTVPTQPSAVVGNANPCSGAIETYYASHHEGVTHTWNLPSGWVLLSGQGSDTITVQTSSNGGNITATSSNVCGSGLANSLAVNIKPLPLQPSTISGLTTPCQGTSQTYFVTPIAGVTYNWSVPTGTTIVSGQGTSTVNVLCGASSGNISVVPANNCGNGPAQSISVTITQLPANPGTISGLTNPCINSTQTYSVVSLPGYSYSWTVPAGWSIASGQGTSTISATTTTTGGEITVTASNMCGAGAPSSLTAIMSLPPAQPSIINGPASPCTNMGAVNYSVDYVAGITYTWTVPTGWTIQSGQNTNAIVVVAGSVSGNISVIPSNGCGAGTPQTMAVTASTGAPQPDPVAGDNNICNGTTQVYSTTPLAGITFSWTIPYGWTFLNGQGTNSITVMAGTNSGTISVAGENVCGTGPATTLQVTVNHVIADAGTDQTINYGSSANLIGNASNGSGSYTYTWVPATLLVNPNVPNPVTLPLTTTTQFALIATDLLTQCSGSDEVNVVVTGSPLLVNTTATPSTLCEGAATQLQAGAINGTGTYTYNWTSIPAGFTSNEANPVTNPMVSTIYSVDVNDGFSVQTGEVSVTVDPLPLQPQQPSGPDTVNITSCPASDYSTEPVANATQYEWSVEPVTMASVSSNGAEATITWLNTGIASVVVKAINTCGQSVSEPLVVLVDQSINIPQADDLKIVLSPNPVSDVLTLEAGLTDVERIEVFAANGAKVIGKDFKSTVSVIQINVSSLETGYYSVCIITKSGCIKKRFLKL